MRLGLFGVALVLVGGCDLYFHHDNGEDDICLPATQPTPNISLRDPTTGACDPVHLDCSCGGCGVDIANTPECNGVCAGLDENSLPRRRRLPRGVQRPGRCGAREVHRLLGHRAHDARGGRRLHPARRGDLCAPRRLHVAVRHRSLRELRARGEADVRDRRLRPRLALRGSSARRATRPAARPSARRCASPTPAAICRARPARRAS